MLPQPTRATLFPYTTLFRSYTGLMLPILEDTRLAQRWSEGHISIDALLSYSAVCGTGNSSARSEEHTSELQSQFHLVCRLLLEKKKLEPSHVSETPGR